MLAQRATDPDLDHTWVKQPGQQPLPRPRPRRLPGTLDAKWTLLSAIVLIIGFSLFVGLVGADARWLAALGHDIATRGRIPDGIPFAAAPTAHWPNVTVLAELLFWALEAALGDRGLVFAQALAVGVAFGTLAWDALRAGAGRQQTASTCLLAALGAVTSLAIVRVQLFSLALFPVLLALLRSDARTRSGRLWLVVPLLAVWSNLHGAVLVGLAVTLIYLAVERLRERPLETVALAALCVTALCANPAGIHALSYYLGVFSSPATQRGEGMWGPLSPASPVDAVLIVVAGVLAARAMRARLAVWEVLVVVLLAAMTIHAARSGIWLLFVLIAPAAVGARPGTRWRQRVVLLAAASVALIAVAALRGPTPSGADGRSVARAMALARGTPILASDIVAEQIALAGGKVWISDPINAFQPRVQSAYLQWMDGDRAGLAAVGDAVRVVLVNRGSPEAALMQKTPGFRAVSTGHGFELFERATAVVG